MNMKQYEYISKFNERKQYLEQYTKYAESNYSKWPPSALISVANSVVLQTAQCCKQRSVAAQCSSAE